MKIYILSGFAPDLSEQCTCILSEVFTDEDKARKRFLDIKSEVEAMLEGCHENGECEFYSTDCHEVRHNPYTLGRFSAKASITPGNKKHVGMWRDWSSLNIGGGSGFSIYPKNVSLNFDRTSDFSVASFGISIKEI